MFRNCVNILNIVSNNLNRGGKYAVFKRHAGHSKWQNIKHNKAAEDAAKSAVAQRLAFRIQIAVREGGPNPEFNRTLKNLVSEAKKCNIPKETIERTIARASGEDSKPAMFLVKGPKNLIFAADVLTNSPVRCKNQLISMAKKFNFSVDQATGHEEYIKRLGLVKSKPLKGSENPLDQALEHAIEVDAEEVTEDEEKNLVFQCHVNRVYQIREKLEGLGYDINFADAVVEFSVQSTLNDTEIELCEKFVNKLEEIPEVTKVWDNIA